MGNPLYVNLKIPHGFLNFLDVADDLQVLHLDMNRCLLFEYEFTLFQI